ncbi:alpha/beta-hydrolase, partial [Parathielavia appendiculata]
MTPATANVTFLIPPALQFPSLTKPLTNKQQTSFDFSIKTMGRVTIWTRQPGFFVYTVYSVVRALIKLPCLMLMYTIPRFRPIRDWTFQQAFVRAMTRLLFEYASVVRFSPAQSLDPGKEKDRFVTIEPFEAQADSNKHNQQQETIYTGIAKPNANGIRPVAIGGTWFPAPFNRESNQMNTLAPNRPRRVFLHFHGGAYVLFDCRDRDMAFGASLLLQASPRDSGAAVFCPQYRLAFHSHSYNGGGGGGGGQFPAALQDAITSYAHLVRRLGVDARDVVLSGDSAGGNLALALLRHLEETKVLPRPGGVLLWSPWTDLSVDVGELIARAEDKWDIVPPRLVEWALRVFLPEVLDDGVEGGRVCDNAYISPVKRGIQTEVPIWVQVGGKEIIAKDILKWVEVQEQTGHRLRVYEIPNAPHDMFMAGEGLGFVKESREAAEDAIRFLDRRE